MFWLFRVALIMFKWNLVLLFLVSVKAEHVAVTVQGRLRGTPRNGYVAYTGIPYGTVSNHTGRFKKAGVAPLWSGIRESQEPRCDPSSKLEECLQLDVHVPSSGGAPWPVLVWIKGGSAGHTSGTLEREGVIVVFVYHRQGPQGFLCTNDENIPGNAGVKDVLTALRWVRDNINAFRGNPAKVVVAGQGFEAAIIEATMLSPASRVLYHGVILQSGTVLSPLAFNYDAEERALMLARRVGGDDAKALLDADVAELAAESDDLPIPFFPFGICKEKAYKNAEQLISEPPIDLLSRKKVNSVPMIIGYNSDEAYIFAFSLKQSKILRRISKDLSVLAPEGLKFLNERELLKVAKQIKDFYFRNIIALPAVMELYRDAYFINHIQRSVRLHATASHHPVYFYQFSHNGTSGVEPEVGLQKTGAAHSDELAYLFVDEKMEGNDGIVQDKLAKLWTNFVKFLNPTPTNDETKWQPVDLQHLQLLNIDTKAEMRSYPHSRASHMWDDIYDKYYYSRGNGK